MVGTRQALNLCLHNRTVASVTAGFCFLGLAGRGTRNVHGIPRCSLTQRSTFLNAVWSLGPAGTQTLHWVLVCATKASGPSQETALTVVFGASGGACCQVPGALFCGDCSQTGGTVSHYANRTEMVQLVPEHDCHKLKQHTGRKCTMGATNVHGYSVAALLHCGS